MIALLFSCTDYDYDTPDTAANRSGFERHFGFPPSGDVENIYYYADELGADALYQLGFTAEPGTVEAIKSRLELTSSEVPFDAWGLVREFDWFRKSDIRDIPGFASPDDSPGTVKRLWYDAPVQRVYYLEYSQ